MKTFENFTNSNDLLMVSRILQRLRDVNIDNNERVYQGMKLYLTNKDILSESDEWENFTEFCETPENKYDKQLVNNRLRQDGLLK